MNIVLAELLKLRRSSVWILVVVLPLFAVISGTVNYVMNMDVFNGEWQSFWAQITLFYGLLYLTCGIAVLAATLWRMEHRGNWPRLLAAPVSRVGIVGAKLAALSLLVVVMQLVLVVAGYAAGVLAAGMPPGLPLDLLILLGLSVLPGIAIAAVQSFASMVIRSFALPIVLAVLAAVVGFGMVLSGNQVLALGVPYAMVTGVLGRMGALTTVAPLTWPVAAQVTVCSLAWAGAFVLAGAAVLRRRDIR